MISTNQQQELLETFERIATMLDEAIKENTVGESAQKGSAKTQNSMPPTSHTLTDLLITLSPHLPREAFPTLFNMASRLLPLKSDPQLQKKAYKLLPRLVTSDSGAAAVCERNPQLQTLMLDSSSTATAPTRRDRLAAIAAVIEHLPSSDLHFIPSILSEVVVSAKEVNEKARTQAFDLLVIMAKKMREGGTVIQARIPSMGPDAPEVRASLEEYFTMVSAGLAGGSPHVVAASIASLTRILFEFASELSRSMIEDLVQTMEVFLSSANREIVRAVLGFVKVAIVSLPEDVIKPRLPQLIPGLMTWSKEHKARFRSKVKHILERLIRRFGPELVEKWSPEDDKKLIHNIRKTRERNKRRKASNNEDNAEQDEFGASTGDNKRHQGDFDNAFDDALYASESSDSESSDSESNHQTNKSKSSQRRRQQQAHRGMNGGDTGANGTYISNPSSGDPLDLLSHSSLAHISTRKPASSSQRKLPKNQQTDMDGKLVFIDDNSSMPQGRKKSSISTAKATSGDADGDAMQIDSLPTNDENISLEQGINAYVDAIRGRDAVQRGRGGRLKYDNRRSKGGEGDDEGDDAAAAAPVNTANGTGTGTGGKEAKRVRFADMPPSRAARGGGRGGGGAGGRRGGFRGSGSGSGSGSGGISNGGKRMSGRGGIAKRVDRRGLGGVKVRGARVGKGRR